MRRAQTHAAVGATLEELHQQNLDEHAGLLAHHFAEGQAVLGAEKLALYCLMAGERALATYAYEDALTHFERGMAARNIALSRTEAASDDEAAALLFGLARARSATGVGQQFVEAFETVSRAFEYYVEVGNVALAVAAAEFPIAPPPFRIPGVAHLLARALTLVPADSHQAGRLLSRYGGILGIAEGDYEGAQKALEQAIAISKKHGDVLLEMQTLTFAAAVGGHHLHWQESVDSGLRAIELATGNENLFSQVASRRWTAMGLLHMGDPIGARPHALVLRDLAERPSTPRFLVGRCLSLNTYLECSEGDWRSAREYRDRGLELTPSDPTLLETRALLEHQTGESTQGELYLERLLEAMRRAGPNQLLASGRASLTIMAVARITGVPGCSKLAEAAAGMVLAEQSVRPGLTIYATAGLALLTVQTGDQSAAAKHYSYLLGQRSTMIGTVLSVDRLLGLLSQSMGEIGQAMKHFEDALAFCRKAGYRPELAWSCFDYADTLFGRNGEADQIRAMTLLEESLAISSDLGMRPLMERVAVLQQRVEAQPVRTPAYPDGLTRREVEVIRLVAQGKTDRQIAEDLIISVNTVGNHVRSILSKTNAANRTEAAAYAAHQGLI